MNRLFKYKIDQLSKVGLKKSPLSNAGIKYVSQFEYCRFSIVADHARHDISIREKN